MDRMISDEEVIEIGRKLKALREKRGLTQQEFADELYWDVSSYQIIESGKALMTLDKAVQIHRNYDVDLNYFVADDLYDEDDVLKQIVANASKEKTARLMIRLFEYFIRLLKSLGTRIKVVFVYSVPYAVLFAP